MSAKLFLSVLVLVGGAKGEQISSQQVIRFFTQADCPPPSPAVAPDGPAGYEEFQEGADVSRGTKPFQSYCVVSGAWKVEYDLEESSSISKLSFGDDCTTCLNKEHDDGARQFGWIQPLHLTSLLRSSIRLSPRKEERVSVSGGGDGEVVIENSESIFQDDPTDEPLPSSSSSSNKPEPTHSNPETTTPGGGNGTSTEPSGSDSIRGTGLIMLISSVFVVAHLF